MATGATVFIDRRRTPETALSDDRSSAVSWAAVFGGAFVIGALSLILLALGTGVGLSAVSPWPNEGASPTAFRAGAIVWLIVVEIIAAGSGGCLAGRLRTKWIGVHRDEVYFRDTAHGFLAWSVGLVMAAAFLSLTAISTMGVAASSGQQQAASSYFTDELFRTTRPAQDENIALMGAEAGAILANGIRAGSLPTRDLTYLGQLVGERTGLNQTAAEQRVSLVFNEERQNVDSARKAFAHFMYWLFLALLVGAFCASFAATFGGMQRDHVRTV